MIKNPAREHEERLPPNVDPRRLAAIDALRGLAALSVIAVHSSHQTPSLSGWLYSAFLQGRYSVQLFFIISAFTLFLSLSSRPQSHSTRDFLIRRFFRIAPLFWCAMVFYLCRDGMGHRGWMGDEPRITPAHIISTATFTNGFYPPWINSIVPGGWSVTVEIIFYLSLPFFFHRIRSLRAAWINVLVWLGVSYLVLKTGQQFHPAFPAQLWKSFLFFWLPNQIPIFALGFVLYFIFLRLPSVPKKWEKRISGALLAMCAASFVGLGFCDSRWGLLHFMYGLLFVALATALLLHPFSILVNRVTIYVGKISFSTYLTHDIMISFGARTVRWIYDHPGWPRLWPILYFIIVYGIILAGTLVIASLTYRLIEAPGQEIGRRIIAWLASKKRSIPLSASPRDELLPEKAKAE